MLIASVKYACLPSCLLPMICILLCVPARAQGSLAILVVPAGLCFCLAGCERLKVSSQAAAGVFCQKCQLCSVTRGLPMPASSSSAQPVLLHGHLRCEIFEAEHLGTAFYSKGNIFKSFFKLMTQNARQVWDKKRHVDRDCYTCIYAGEPCTFAAESSARASPACFWPS